MNSATQSCRFPHYRCVKSPPLPVDRKKTKEIIRADQLGIANGSGRDSPPLWGVTLDLHREIGLEMPEHEFPACRTEEGKLAIGAGKANRVLHDTIWVGAMS